MTAMIYIDARDHCGNLIGRSSRRVTLRDDLGGTPALITLPPGYCIADDCGGLPRIYGPDGTVCELSINGAGIIRLHLDARNATSVGTID